MIILNFIGFVLLSLPIYVIIRTVGKRQGYLFVFRVEFFESLFGKT